MNAETTAIEIQDLVHLYKRSDGVHGLNLRVKPGRCYGFFGRNGAGKTTTIKCMVGLLRPQAGKVRLFGLDPLRRAVEVKSRLSYVPDQVHFYPWMTIGDTLAYQASFRPGWNYAQEQALLDQFHLDPKKKAVELSKGQKTQVALIGAICAQPELLLLDEPTSGLDPLVRREFIQTLIGSYQEQDPEHRTVFVSTHLIAEFEGLIDEFCVVENGRDIITLEADAARAKYQRIRARFPQSPPLLNLPEIIHSTHRERELELVVSLRSERLMETLRSHSPDDITLESLSLEEVFLASLRERRAA